MSGWYASDSARWPGRLERLRRLGPLEEDDAREDLRYLESEHRLWMRTDGRSGQRFPGRPELANRWGWTEWKTRTLLSADDWHDPQQPVASADLRQPAARKPPAFHQETASSATVEPEQSPTKPPAFRQPAASVPPALPPHARPSPFAPEHRTPEHRVENARTRDPAWVTGPVHDPAVAEMWRDILAVDPIVPQILPETPDLEAARAVQEALPLFGWARVLSVAVWVFRDDPEGFWRSKNPSPARWLDRRHFGNLEASAKAGALGVGKKAGSASESWVDRERREIAERNARFAEQDKKNLELQRKKEVDRVRARDRANGWGDHAGAGVDPGRLLEAADLVGPVIRDVVPKPARGPGPG